MKQKQKTNHKSYGFKKKGSKTRLSTNVKKEQHILVMDAQTEQSLKFFIIINLYDNSH